MGNGLKIIIGILIFLVFASQTGLLDLGNLFSTVQGDLGASPLSGAVGGSGG